MPPKRFYLFIALRHLMQRLARLTVALIAAPGWLPLTSVAQVKPVVPTQSSSHLPQPSPLELQLAPTLEEHPLQADDVAARFVVGEHIKGKVDQQVDVTGQGEVRTPTAVIQGDKLRYVAKTDQADAYGRVRLMHNGNTFKGTRAQLKVGANEGYMLSPTYRLGGYGAMGSAKRIDLLDPDHIYIEQGTYTTCECDNPAWYLKASSFSLDTGTNTGVARNGVLFFKHVPLFASPYVSFPLSNERKSGFLPPIFVPQSSTSGFTLTLPYYVNLAPNRDLTLYPRFSSRRGMQLGAEYRYLMPDYQGSIFVEGSAHDEVTKTSRFATKIQHNQRLADGLGAYLNYSRVSDSNYPRDIVADNFFFGGMQLLYQQEGGVTYRNGPWSVLARVQHWQTLPPSISPYGREPQLNVKYQKYDVANFDLDVNTDYSRFRVNTADLVQGQRFVFNPTLSYPLVASDYFLVPKLRYHIASYQLDSIPQPMLLARRDFTVQVPTFSLDGGLIFERPVSFLGEPYIQTLEPRLYYVYTPYRQQDFVPIFDTAESDFSVAEIYNENTFVGDDRVADANRLTAGLTTRFIEAASGNERARFVVAQQYYLRQQRIVLKPELALARANHSDWLAGGSYRLDSRFVTQAAVQYNPDNRQVIRSSVGFSWMPAEQKVLNLSYRYTRPNTTLNSRPIRQILVSAQWPLTHKLYGVGRVNYDLKGHRVTNSLIGFQYSADCWALGLAVQRYANGINFDTQAPRPGTRILAQFELKGLSKIENGLIQQFRAGVPGYTPAPAPVPASRFTDYD